MYVLLFLLPYQTLQAANFVTSSKSRISTLLLVMYQHVQNYYEDSDDDDSNTKYKFSL